MCPSDWDGEMVVVCVWQLGSCQCWMFAVRLSLAHHQPGNWLWLRQTKGTSLSLSLSLSLSCLWQGWIWEKWTVTVDCVFYHRTPDKILVPPPSLGRSGLSSPGLSCISPDTSNIANCKHSLFVHPIPSHQTNTTSHPHHNPPHTTTYYLTALLLKFQLDRN